MAFHLAITKASHNELLLSMYSYVDRITVPSRLLVITAIIQEEETAHFVHLHQIMLNLVEQKEPSTLSSRLT